MDKLQIIGAPQSTFVRTVRMAAEEKGVPYEIVPAAPHTPEVLAIHPLGRIPAMRHGDLMLCESKAIATYMDAAFPGPRLIPDDLRAKAYVEQWVSLMNSGFQLAFGPYLAAYFFPGTADGSPDRARIDAVLEKVEHALTVIAHGVAERGHLVGDSFTLADIAVLPTLAYLKELPESAAMIAARPALAAYMARHATRPCVQATATPPPGAEARAAVAAALSEAAA